MPNWIKKTLITCFWLLIWQLGAMLINNDIIMASPLQTIVVMFQSIITLTFWASILFTMLRILLGFLLAFVLALALGLLAWRWHFLSELLAPAITFIKSVPIVCFIVMLLIWFGSRWVSFTAVFLVAFPAIYFAVVEGLEQRDQKLHEMLQVFRVSGIRKMLAYYWSTILPFLQAASKVAVGMSWKSGVAAELIGLPLGSIGANIYQAKILLESANIFSWTFVVVALGILSEKIFLWMLMRSEEWAWRASLPRCPQVDAPPSTHPTPLPIIARDITKLFDDKPVLNHLSFTLAPAGRYALSAPSGTGKTTLLRVLVGQYKPDSGSLENGNRVSMVFQEARLFEKRNAVENIQLVTEHSCSLETIRTTLTTVLPEDSLTLPVSQLSGGMRRRVELCRALLAPSQVILLDEPFTGLDPATSDKSMTLLTDMLKGRTLVLVTHNQRDIGALAAEPLSISNTG